MSDRSSLDPARAFELLTSPGRYGRRIDCVPRLLAVQNRRLGSPLGSEDLADLTQECLIVIWRKAGEFRPETAFESWAWRICLLELCNFLRKARRRRRLMVEAAERLREDRGGDPPPTVPEHCEIVYLALGVLDGEEEAVVRMRHFEERSFEEVGHRLRIPTGTAKTRYYRGLTKMKQYVRNHDAGREAHGLARS